LPKGKRLHLN